MDIGKKSSSKRLQSPDQTDAEEEDNDQDMSDIADHEGTKEKQSQLYSCPIDGCVCTFQRHTNMENHVLYGKCRYMEERHTLMDKAKILYQQKLIAGTSQQPTLADDASSGTEATEKLEQGWALKTSKKKGRFNDNQRKYLDDKFKIGQQTGHKADPEQVSLDMRYAKNDDGSRRFTVDDYLSAQQIKSYFSRTSSKLRNLDTADADLEAITEQEEYSNTREAIIKECQITHPITYDTHNICELHAAEALRKKFSVAMLHLVCEYLRIDVGHLKGTRFKAPYIDLISELVKSCSCTTE